MSSWAAAEKTDEKAGTTRDLDFFNRSQEEKRFRIEDWGLKELFHTRNYPGNSAKDDFWSTSIRPG
jgi:hypothetical protein